MSERGMRNREPAHALQEFLPLDPPDGILELSLQTHEPHCVQRVHKCDRPAIKATGNAMLLIDVPCP